MKLQILIPQYKETDDIVKTLLDSIALQQRVDFDEIGVIICNDGSDAFMSEEMLNSYPFEVQYHKEPHRGVSATRNACLDYANDLIYGENLSRGYKTATEIVQAWMWSDTHRAVMLDKRYKGANVGIYSHGEPFVSLELTL